MREAFVNITDIPTHIMTWGPWIEESFTKKEVVICVTGNPGLPGFYTKFMSTIHETLGQDMPVWVIGHAGHDEPPKSSIRKIPPLAGNEAKYGLHAQVQHKVEFIKTYVPDDVKIHLIGHSIGAWMVIELLKNTEIKSKIQHCYLLFPTFERMAASSNGFLYTKLVRPSWFILRRLVVLFGMLPVMVQVFLLSIYFFVMSMPRTFMGTALKYSRVSIMDKVLHLADDEMRLVVDADYNTLVENKEILKVYYGASDGWTPKKYCYQLQERVTGIDAQIDIYNIAHAFVLRSSEEMGKLMAGWIIEYKR